MANGEKCWQFTRCKLNFNHLKTHKLIQSNLPAVLRSVHQAWHWVECQASCFCQSPELTPQCVLLQHQRAVLALLLLHLHLRRFRHRSHRRSDVPVPVDRSLSRLWTWNAGVVRVQGVCRLFHQHCVWWVRNSCLQVLVSYLKYYIILLQDCGATMYSWKLRNSWIHQLQRGGQPGLPESDWWVWRGKVCILV